jgi:hypothetical protein
MTAFLNAMNPSTHPNVPPIPRPPSLFTVIENPFLKSAYLLQSEEARQ